MLELVQEGGCSLQRQQSFSELMNPWYKSVRSGHMPAIEWHLEQAEVASFVDACRAKVVGIQLLDNPPPPPITSLFNTDPKYRPAHLTIATIIDALQRKSIRKSVSGLSV